MAMLMESVYFASKANDLGSGFWMVFVKLVVLLLMIFWGMKAVMIGCSCKGFVRFLGYQVPRGKSAVSKSIWCLRFGVAVLCSLKIGSCKVSFFRFNDQLKNSSSCIESVSLSKSCERVEGISNDDDDPKSNEPLIDDHDQEEDKEELENDDYEEDEEGEEEMDLMALKRVLSIERKLKNAAHLELEKERNAAASSANEAMAMILRLQNEKSSIRMQADHCFKLAEQQHMYDQEVIESLNWIILKHESELNLCKQKLKQYMKPGEEEELEEGTDWASTILVSTANGDDSGECNKPFEMDSEFM